MPCSARHSSTVLAQLDEPYARGSSCCCLVERFKPAKPKQSERVPIERLAPRFIAPVALDRDA
jgi:hypothetical protein